MAPIHDTDLAESRWAQTSWDRYELWEKVEQRLRRRRSFWIAGTVAVFLALSSVPIVIDRWPRWSSLALARQIGQVIDDVKKDASIAHEAYRIRILADLSYEVERAADCRAPRGTPVRTGRVGGSAAPARFVVIDAAQGQALGVPGIVTEFCYDSLNGASTGAAVSATAVAPGAPLPELSGFGVIPVNDLAAGRADRLAVLLLHGPYAEASFD